MSTIEKKVNEFKDESKKQAEEIIKDVFPKKILDLNHILESDAFSLDRIKAISETVAIPVPDPIILSPEGKHISASKKRRLDNGQIVSDLPDVSGSKVLVLPHGPVECNPFIRELCEQIKPEIRELMEYANKITMWIQFLKPRIEDGNNFGVGVQEEAQAQASQVETDSAAYIDQISRYYATRARLVSKIAKYPHVIDYRQAVVELDEKQFITLRLVVCELRNLYSSLHDLIIKNMEKIKLPKSANAENLY